TACVSRFHLLPFLFFLRLLPRSPRSTLFPYTTLFRSEGMTPILPRQGFTQDHLNTYPGGRPRSYDLAEGGGFEPPEVSLKSYERSEEHTSELQSRFDLVCRLLLEKKKKQQQSK